MGLAIEDLAIERGGRLVLENFSASIRPGAALLLRGSNGSGKTSLLRTIAGFLQPHSGYLSWNGEPLTQSWRQDGGRIAFLGHQDGLKNDLTVGENLVFWARLMNLDGNEESLSAVGLDHLRDRQARFLSAGQRRRLAFARLLLGHWDLWLLDEPMNALDDQAIASVTHLIRRQLARGGIAIVAHHQPIDLPGTTCVLDSAGSIKDGDGGKVGDSA